MIALLLTLASAQAQDPGPATTAPRLHLTATAGWAAGVNDPFVKRRGPQLGLELGPTPWLALGARGAFYPSLGQADWKPLTDQLVSELHVAPDISRITARAELYARAAPLSREIGDWTSDLGLVVGGGAVRTVDDLEALQAEGDPVAESTQVQLHPTFALGLSAGLRWGPFGVRVDATRLAYVETVAGTTTENKNPVFLGVDFAVHLP